MGFPIPFRQRKPRSGRLPIVCILFGGVLAVSTALPETALCQAAYPETTLVGSDSVDGDWFGRSLAIDGETLIVGAPHSDPNGIDGAGAAYIFVRVGDLWTEQAKLVAPDGEVSDGFGTAVAISGDTVVVTAPGYDSSAVNSGGAYVFVRDGVSWSHQDTLVGSDAWEDTSFGGNVSISGDTVVAGDPGDDHPPPNAGAVYIFVRSGTDWTEELKLQADDRIAADAFGQSVAIDGDTLVVGASGSNRTPDNAGLLYVFVRSGGAWIQEDQLTLSDPSASDALGCSVSLSGDTLLAGARGEDPNDIYNAGAAYVFVRSGGTWFEQAMLAAPEPVAYDNAGFAVALSGDVAVVGAPFAAPNTPRPGKAYLFERTGAAWSEGALVRPVEDPPTYYEFGRSVAISGSTFVIGTHTSTAPPTTGAAYAYDIPPTDPVTLIDDLMVQVVSLGLPPRVERNLLARLARVSRMLTDGSWRNDARVPRVLERFIGAVERQRDRGNIPEEDAAALIEATLEVIALVTTEGT